MGKEKYNSEWRMISIVNILRNAYQGIEARTSSHFMRDVQVSRPRRCPARRKSDCDRSGTSDRSVGLPEDAFVPLIELELSINKYERYE